MRTKKQTKAVSASAVQDKCYAVVEDLLEKKLDDLTTILSESGTGKSRLHEEVMAMVEKGLFKIALRRSGYVKSTAAGFLGINRNTFTDKMTKLGIDCKKIK